MKKEKIKNEKWRKLYLPSRYTLFDSFFHDAANREVEEWERVERERDKTRTRADGVIITCPRYADDYKNPLSMGEEVFLGFLLIVKLVLLPLKILSDIFISLLKKKNYESR